MRGIEAATVTDRSGRTISINGNHIEGGMRWTRWMNSSSNEQITIAMTIGFMVVIVVAMAALYLGTYSLRP
jgi:hypothetical protein